MIKLNQETSVQYLKGIGPRLAVLLKKCGIVHVQDMLFYLPYRYQDKTIITPIGQAKEKIGEWIVVEGMITKTEHKRRLICHLQDISGQISLIFFNTHFVEKSTYTVGTRLRCFGQVKSSTMGMTLIHPECQRLCADSSLPVETCLTPIYASTEGISQKIWQKISEQALLSLYKSNFTDDLYPYLPDFLKITLQEALYYLHRPPKNVDIALLLSKKHPAYLRLSFEELLAHHLSVKFNRQKIRADHTAPILSYQPANQKIQLFLKNLGFTLTSAQKKAVNTITQEIAQSNPMLRLLQGDVGSGKTVVAAVAALQTVCNHYQVALMVPTELLSEQHYWQLSAWLSDLGVTVVRLHSQLTLSDKKKVIHQLAHQDQLIVIGTQALFQEQIIFKNLGLVIIDEQHRFGVLQRMALQQKGKTPHQLMMTATPIPRTLAMTLYANMDISVIDELPKGRMPITTLVIAQTKKMAIIERIRQAHHEKRQIYWVCPLINQSEQLQCQAATETYHTLCELLPELNIALLHGRLKNTEKAEIMRNFKQGNSDILVATTVIEVGIDVPNATVMIIENAERLGLSQLHQLRGRVGRGAQESHCLLLYQSPLSSEARTRLNIMRTYQDGFNIAEKDLTLRGAGELLGTRQSGACNFRIADVSRDQDLLPLVQQIADYLLQTVPQVANSIVARWLGDAVWLKV